MAEQTRRSLLDAAYHVLTIKGVAGLTLDAVAAQAKVSKGGVLYHFRSKNALFEGMLADVIEHCDRDIEGFLLAEPETVPPTPGRYLRAYIRSNLSEVPEEEHEMGSAILSAIAADPAWARVYWPAVERWRNRGLTDGVSPPLALALMSAADGLSIWDALGIGEGSKALRAATREQLLSLTYVTP